MKATCGRIVNVYSKLWNGPRPGTVIVGWGETTLTIGSQSFPGELINVNVALDGANDAAVLAEFRQRPQGNTFTSVPLVQAGSLVDVSAKPEVWCEWPSMPTVIDRISPLVEQVNTLTGQVTALRASVQQAPAGNWTGGDIRPVIARLEAGLCHLIQGLESDTAGAIAKAKAAVCPDPDPFRIDVDAMAGEIHRRWLLERDRSYSPFNKPWSELTFEERQQISKQSSGIVDMLAEAGVLHPNATIDNPYA